MDPQKDNSQHPVQAASAQKPRVLIVDDEAGFRDLMVFELGFRGYEVITAADGEEAVEKTGAQDIDVIVCDLTMPKLGGLDALSRFKNIIPDVEVIMVTGYGTIESAIESMKRGAYDFLTKPFQVDDLLRLVSRALEKRRLNKKVDSLTEVNRFKSEFLANMSHELRVPLNAIIGYTSLHLDKIYGEVSEKQREALEKVNDSGKDLLKLVDAILDLSKMSTGRMPVYLEEFDLSDLTLETIKMMDCIAKAKGLKMESAVQTGLVINSDKTKIRQILLNLIDNAIKFTPAGWVKIEVKKDKDIARISVQDTGIGIKTEDVGQLFREFKQLAPTFAKEHGGAGLGLAISKKFADLLGGDVVVESSPGRGSVFTVVIPVRAEKPRRSLTALPDFSLPAGAGPENIVLAIDDDPDMLTLLKDGLKGTEYFFAGALTGPEGIAMAKKICPTAIILDILMPHQDGWSVLKNLKSDPELSGIPVMVLSVLDNKSLGYALGAADFMVKPFDRRKFLERLRILKRRDGVAAAPAAALKILAVEDDAAIVEYFRETMYYEGYQVETALNGKEALKKMSVYVPDILFLDIIMPDVNGFEVLEAVGKDARLKDMFIVVLTAKHLSPEESALLQQKTHMVIQKGSQSLADILELVKKKVKKSRADLGAA